MDPPRAKPRLYREWQIAAHARSYVTDSPPYTRGKQTKDVERVAGLGLNPTYTGESFLARRYTCKVPEKSFTFPFAG